MASSSTHLLFPFFSFSPFYSGDQGRELARQVIQDKPETRKECTTYALCQLNWRYIVGCISSERDKKSIETKKQHKSNIREFSTNLVPYILHSCSNKCSYPQHFRF